MQRSGWVTSYKDWKKERLAEPFCSSTSKCCIFFPLIRPKEKNKKTKKRGSLFHICTAENLQIYTCSKQQENVYTWICATERTVCANTNADFDFSTCSSYDISFSATVPVWKRKANHITSLINNGGNSVIRSVCCWISVLWVAPLSF